jgi:hypothetical protein
MEPIGTARGYSIADVNGDHVDDFIKLTAEKNVDGAWVVRQHICYGGRDSNRDGTPDIQQDGIVHEERVVDPKDITVNLDRNFTIVPNGVDAPILRWDSQTITLTVNFNGDEEEITGSLPATPLPKAELYKHIEVVNRISE